MKVLHITSSSKGGAGIAALRLHKALCENGISSGYLSSNLTIDFSNKIVADTFFQYKKPTVLKKIANKFKHYFLSGAHQKALKKLAAVKDKMHFEMATLPFSRFQLQNHPLVQEADLINLHWMGGILDYPHFFEQYKKPVVWTLHDMNPFQGLFHYKNDTLLNAKIIGDFEEEMKLLKTTAMKQINRGAIIAPSTWLLGEAEKSGVFAHFIKECIPNAIDLDIFKPLDKLAIREKYAIPNNDFVLLFIADYLKNTRKGFDLLLEALSHLDPIPMTIVAIGKGEIPVINNIKLISLGEITEAGSLVECFALADAFILPSKEDNLPNVMLEAFACGIPVIGFPIGGIAEHVKEHITGVLAEEISGLSLAKAIKCFYETRDEYKQTLIRKYAEDNFSFKKQAQAYQKAYHKILSK